MFHIVYVKRCETLNFNLNEEFQLKTLIYHKGF